MNIYCCNCKKTVKARLTSGSEIYAHRKDLASLPFWICDVCNGYVGCHHKTTNRTRPLGVIPSLEIKSARKHLHELIDPMWRGKKKYRKARKSLYNKISDYLGYEFHCAEIKSIDEARKVYRYVASMRREK